MESPGHIPNKRGVGKFLLGAIIGFVFFSAMFLQDTEAIVFSAGVSGDETLRSMRCPDLLTHDEIGKVSVTIHNRTEKSLYRTVRAHISEGFLTFKQEHTEIFEMQSGESRTLSWPVSVKQAAWGYVTLVKVYVLPQRPYPSYVGTCGIAWLDIPYLEGWQIITAVWLVSLALMGYGLKEFLEANKPLVRKKRSMARNLVVIVGMVIAGMASIFLEFWYIELLLFILTIILLAESVFAFSQD